MLKNIFLKKVFGNVRTYWFVLDNNSSENAVSKSRTSMALM